MALRIPVRLALLSAVAIVAIGAVAGGGPAGASVRLTTIAASSTGLVAAYSFDEGSGTTVTDWSGSGNAGTVSNASWSSAGKYAGALSFNGASSWVTIPDAASLDLTTGMTLEGWVKPTALGTDWRCVLFKERPSDMTYSLYANESTGHPVGQVYQGKELNALGSSGLPLNAWTFLAATYDGTTLRLYVNGSQVGNIVVGAVGDVTRARGGLASELFEIRDSARKAGADQRVDEDWLSPRR